MTAPPDGGDACPALNVPRAFLDASLDFYSGTHLVPVIKAVRDHGVGYVILQRRDRGRFTIPGVLRGRGLLIVIGDDLETSKGPDAFRLGTIRGAMRAATRVAVHAAAAKVSHYALFAKAAARGERVVVVETQEAHESAWLRFATKHAPRTPLLVVTPRAASWSRQRGHA